MAKLSIFLIDDHAMIREGLKRLIAEQSDFVIAGEADGPSEAFDQIIAVNPDLVVLDISTPTAGSAQLTKKLRAASGEIKILALAAHDDRGTIREMLEAGAAGYLLKRAGADELIHAIRSVSAGGVYVDPRVAANLVSTVLQPSLESLHPDSLLSERELSVMRLIVHGYSNKEIASQLGVSVKTIETYKARSMEKLGLRSRVDIVRHASKNNWPAPS